MLRRLVPDGASLVLYADHVEAAGTRLFSAFCSMDIEGIVESWKTGHCLDGGETTSGIKIKNPHYTQARAVAAEAFARGRR